MSSLAHLAVAPLAAKRAVREAVGSRMRNLFIGLLALAILAIAPVDAQSPNVPDYSQDELDQLLAPVALYPDELLMQVLIASTYPLEVIEAARFVQQNPDLRGDALDQALAGKSWDPSVQSLAAFPQVLAMMNDEIEWMQRLGDAFLADQQRVMDTVQSLRQRAEAAGNLQSTSQQSVIVQGDEIDIEPAQPDVVYVPVYNPLVIYGPWWIPAYPPWFWYPPAIYGYPVGVAITTGILFGTAWAISHNHWGWARPDWHGHHVNLNVTDNRFWNRPGRPPPVPGGAWQHEPAHRGGVPYPNAATLDRYMRVDPNAVRARQDFRGHELAPPASNVTRPGAGTVRPAPSVVQPRPGVARPAPNVGLPMPQIVRPAPRPSTPAFDPGLSRQQVQRDAQRGQQSRQSMGPAPVAPGRAPAGGGRAPAAAPAPHGNVRQR